jgi:hypothetical protein
MLTTCNYPNNMQLSKQHAIIQTTCQQHVHNIDFIIPCAEVQLLEYDAFYEADKGQEAGLRQGEY